jgi:hypothetical protein
MVLAAASAPPDSSSPSDLLKDIAPKKYKGGRRPGQKVVHWKDTEREQVIDMAARAIFEGKFEEDDMSGALNYANERMPEGRVRMSEVPGKRLSAGATNPWFEPAVKQRLKQARAAAARETKKKERLTAAPEPVIDTPREEEDAQQQQEITSSMRSDSEHVPQVTQPETASVLTPSARLTIRDMLVRELSSIFDEALEASVRRAPEILESVLRSHIAPVEPPRPRPEDMRSPRTSEDVLKQYMPRTAKAPPKQSVLIVGLRGGQEDVVKMKYGDDLDLRFHGTTDNKVALHDKAASANVTIGFTDFMSHTVEAVIR